MDIEVVRNIIKRTDKVLIDGVDMEFVEQEDFTSCEGCDLRCLSDCTGVPCCPDERYDNKGGIFKFVKK